MCIRDSYGLLSPTDSVQYIRVEKAFVDPTISALTLAQIADSLYYDNETTRVEIRDEANDINHLLNRVDGNLEGLVRDEGAFAQSPNYLYRVSTDEIDFREGNAYSLRIERGNNLPTITATTNLVGESLLFSPNPMVGTTRIDFDQERPTTFSWGPGSNAIVYDLILDVFYTEKEFGGSFEDRSFRWVLAQNLNDTEFIQEGREFYAEMVSNIPENENVEERKFTGFDVIVRSGNITLQEFVRVGQANLGITSTQDVPTFTNLEIEGSNLARGIFASRFTNRFENKFPLSSGSLDSLINGSITADLKFVR